MCSMGYRLQCSNPLKLAPVNGVNVCELVFVSEMDVLNTCFQFQTIYQVGVLQ